MSRLSLRAGSAPDMDDAASEDATPSLSHQNAGPARATTTSSGRGRGRGRWARSRAQKVAKPPQQKASAGRGRRQKVYDSLKVQAAHERIQELKQAYSAVTKLVKPAVLELADRSINELSEDPSAFKRVPEYASAKDFLRERHQDTIEKCDTRLKYDLAMAEQVYQAECQKTHEAYNTELSELCEERYGQLLQQLDILERLYDQNLPVDLPAMPDDSFVFKDMSEEEAACQGVFYETEDGVEIPFSGRKLSELMVKPQTLPLEASKRKADGQPDGQPASKTAAAAKDDDAVAPMPRHTASLLSAVEAIEESERTTPDSGSNAPSPAAELADDVARERAAQPAASGAETPTDGPDLPIPRGATEPDEYGVRLIERRATRMDVPNNRIMVPNLFEWDDLDIGFRDSANCPQKGATKQRRGKYLGKPGSNYMFVDRRAGIWDATLAAGELDEELVKKHKLHPTLGLVLPDSVNEWEPPKPLANGRKSVVFVAPNGDHIHASRTMAAARVDEQTEAAERRTRVAQLLRTVSEQEGISEEDVAPEPELVAKRRAEQLLARGIDPAQRHRPEPSPPAAAAEPPAEPAPEGVAGFTQLVDDILSTAAAIDAQEEAARMAAPPPKRPPPARPYDAIRDVFTDSPVARQPSPPAVREVAAPAPAPATAPEPSSDTTGLSFLADAALQPAPDALTAAVVEPARYDQGPPSGLARPSAYDQPQQPTEYSRPVVEYPRPDDSGRFTRQDAPPAPVEPARTNDFLRTALNTRSLTPPMTAAQEYLGGVPVAPAPAAAPPPNPLPAAQPSLTTSGRTPFSNPGSTKALPALRPVRHLLNEPPTLPDPQSGSPALHHGSMAVSNSGAYFPPAASRPFHNAYSMHEPGPHMPPLQPMQPVMPQPPPLTGPLLGPSPARRTSPTPPPPSYRHQSLAPQGLGPAPAQPAGVHAPMHLQAAQPPLVPASVAGTRSRPGSSSAPAPGSALAASKYRKLEPAPTPPHRLSYSGNGQELRTVQFDYREAIKDYTPIEAPPRHGPTQIRGWTHNNIRPKVAARPPSSRADVGGHGTHANAGPSPDEPSA